MGAPTLYHEETGTITITSDLSFKVARVVWDAIAEQTGGTKICAGIGTVKRCPNGKDEVLVAFDKGMEWMERKNLTLVPV